MIEKDPGPTGSALCLGGPEPSVEWGPSSEPDDEVELARKMLRKLRVELDLEEPADVEECVERLGTQKKPRFQFASSNFKGTSRVSGVEEARSLVSSEAVT